MASTGGFALSNRHGDRWCGKYRPPLGVGDHLALLMMRPVRNDWARDRTPAPGWPCMTPGKVAGESVICGLHGADRSAPAHGESALLARDGSGPVSTPAG